MPTAYEVLCGGRVTPKSRVYLSGLCCLLRTHFECAACGFNQVALWCGLKLASGFVGSVASCEGIPSRLRSAATCDLSGVI